MAHEVAERDTRIVGGQRQAEAQGEAGASEAGAEDNEKKSLKVIRTEAEKLETEAKQKRDEATERLEKSKYCNHCRKHTAHKETK